MVELVKNHSDFFRFKLLQSWILFIEEPSEELFAIFGGLIRELFEKQLCNRQY